MRLRRLEIAIIGLTLAFAFFMGGFFTGRNWSSVNITAVATQSGDIAGDGAALAVVQTSVTQSIDSPTDNGVTTGEDSLSMNIAVEETMEPQVAGEPRAGDGRININLASQAELTDLPGIGSTLASRIIDYRRQHGDFQRIEDLRNVSGIGEKRFEAIQDKITVGR